MPVALAVALIGIRVLMDIATAKAGTPGPRGATGATGATGPQGMILHPNTFMVSFADCFLICFLHSEYAEVNLDCYYCHHIVFNMNYTYLIKKILMLLIIVNFRRTSKSSLLHRKYAHMFFRNPYLRRWRCHIMYNYWP